jgi:TRAF3-interacting protein 1
MIECLGNGLFIHVLAMATASDIKLNPSKVIAGLEPEETNRFLQTLGKAALKKVDTRQAVRKILHKDPSV